MVRVKFGAAQYWNARESWSRAYGKHPAGAVSELNIHEHGGYSYTIRLP